MSLCLVQTDGAELEAEVATTSHPRFPHVGVIIIHPYSVLGGSMHDFVVTEFFRQAHASGLFAQVMRYNQRSVGRSKGRRLALKNLRGQEDAGDVTSMVEFLCNQLPGPSPRVVIIGYSFGACLGAYALEDPRVAAYIGVSFPLGGLSAILQTKAGFQKVCTARKIPRLLVLGSVDQYTKVAAIEEAMKVGGGVRLEEESEEGNRRASLPGGEVGSSPGASVGSLGVTEGGNSDVKPLELKIFPGNGHFWESDCALMVEFCVGYLEKIFS